MILSLPIIVLALLILIVFYFITSIMIREVAEYILKLPGSTFHKSSEVAIVLSAVVLLQLIVGKSWILNALLLIAFIELLYVMTKHIYEVERKQALIMTACVVVGWIVMLAIIAGILVLFPAA